ATAGRVIRTLNIQRATHCEYSPAFPQASPRTQGKIKSPHKAMMPNGTKPIKLIKSVDFQSTLKALAGFSLTIVVIFGKKTSKTELPRSITGAPSKRVVIAYCPAAEVLKKFV